MGGKIALVDEFGAFLRVKDGRFQLKVKDKVKWDIAPVEVDSIVFTTRGASLSISALELASKFGIDVVVVLKNKPVARLIPATYGSTAKIWEKQAIKAEDRGFAGKISRLIVEAKIHNQKMVLKEYSKRIRASGKRNPKLERSIREIEETIFEINKCNTPEHAMEVEAHAAKHYWSAVSTLIPEELGFRRRLRKGDVVSEEEVDVFNKALNIGYGILRSFVWKSVFLAGLNPYIGFLHKFRSGRMSLVFDLMEPFRPVSVDRPLISMARSKPNVLAKLKSEKKSEVKEAVIEVWRTVVNYMGKAKPPHEALILEQARSLARELRGAGLFKPYKSRW